MNSVFLYTYDLLKSTYKNIFYNNCVIMQCYCFNICAVLQIYY